jgi:hypothetical protein
MTRIFSRRIAFLFPLILLVLSAGAASAQSTEFTYQGRLTQCGNPADGLYDAVLSDCSRRAALSGCGCE